MCVACCYALPCVASFPRPPSLARSKFLWLLWGIVAMGKSIISRKAFLSQATSALSEGVLRHKEARRLVSLQLVIAPGMRDTHPRFVTFLQQCARLPGTKWKVEVGSQRKDWHYVTKTWEALALARQLRRLDRGASGAAGRVFA